MEVQNAKVPKENVAECYSALRELRAHKQNPVLGKCMFWADHCATPPIGSHLLSRSWLEQIASISHEVTIGVMALHKMTLKQLSGIKKPPNKAMPVRKMISEFVMR